MRPGMPDAAGGPTARAATASSREPDRALIIADDIGVFLAVARSLGRAGIEVGVATSEHDYPGLKSRYMRRVHTVPPYLSRTAEWLDALDSLVEQYRYRLIFPTSDSSLVLLAEHVDRLGRERVAVPNSEALAAFADKTATRRLAAELGVSTATGMAVGPDTAAAELERSFGLPLVLKPSSSYRPGHAKAKTAASILATSEDVARELARGRNQGLVAEQFFPGEGVGVSVLAHEGRVRLAWQHRRLAAVGPTGRSSARKGEAVDPVLLRDVEALAKEVRLSGVAMFEFRQNPGTRAHILIEVNCRFWGSLPLALAGGADFPLELWRQLTGSAAAPPERRIALVRKKSLQGECERLGAESPASTPRGLWARAVLLLEAIVRPTAFDGWAKDDPGPHREELRQWLGGFLRRLQHPRAAPELPAAPLRSS
jgi:predicted ATP-grasp superfamily ATP-dependent carboligase